MPLPSMCTARYRRHQFVQWSEDAIKAEDLSQKVMGSTLRAVLGGGTHSRGITPLSTGLLLGGSPVSFARVSEGGHRGCFQSCETTVRNPVMIEMLLLS